MTLLQSCVFHPPYERPCVEVPCTWRTQTNDLPTYANLQWWKQLGDPVLDALIEEALHHNKDLKVAMARVWEFYARLGIVAADLLPTVTANGTALRNELSAQTSFLPVGFPRTYNAYALTLNLSYEVDLWGRVRSATEASLADLFREVDVRRGVVLSLVTNVANTYMLMRQYDKQLSIAKQTLKSRIESFDLAVARYEGGLTSELEVMQAASEVEDARAQVVQFEILVPQQENLLSFLIGHNPEAIVRGPPIDDLTLPPVIPEGLPSDLLDQRPDIMAAEQSLIAANARTGEAKALFFPQISLTGSYGNESLALHELFTSPTRAWTYGVNIIQTLFDGGKIYSQIDQAEAIKCEAYYDYLSKIQNAFREVDDALITHKLTVQLVLVEKERVRVLAEYLKLANMRYEEGQTDYLNVLDAERQLFNGQLDYAAAQSNSFITLINVYAALGGGWVIDSDSEAISDFACDSPCY